MIRKRSYNWLTTGLAIGASFLLAFLIILCVSDAPGTTIMELIAGPFSSARNIASIVERASSLIFTGLAISIIFKTGAFSVGVEGSFYLGAVAAAAIALSAPKQNVFFGAVALMGATLAGAAFCFIPAILKKKWGADEFVVSIMLNYVALYLGLYIINTFFLDSTANTFGTKKLPEEMLFPKLIPGTRIHAGIIITIIVAAAVWFFLLHSRSGYQMKLVGSNEQFARYVGIPVGIYAVISQVLGGAIAGLGGAVELLGMYSRFQWSNLPGYGWDGVIVAILARNNPAMVPVAALFLAYLRVGSDIMAVRSDIPAQLITVIQAIMIMLVTANALVTYFKRRGVAKEMAAHEHA